MQYQDVTDIITLFKSKAPTSAYLYEHPQIEYQGIRYGALTIWEDTTEDALKAATLDIRGCPQTGEFEVILHWKLNEICIITEPLLMKELINRFVKVSQVKLTA